MPPQLIANACKHSYNVTSVVACSPETPNLTELAESVDDTLFQRIMHNPHHVLYHLLPERRELVYRPRHHDRQLSIISGQLRKRNFIYRMFSCSKTLINCFITVFTRVLFIRIFTCILILCSCVLSFCIRQTVLRYDGVRSYRRYVLVHG